MSKRRTPLNTPTMRRALWSLKKRISGQYSGTAFRVRLAHDPFALALEATVDTDDTFEVYSLVGELLAKYQVEQRLPLRVRVRLTPERQRQNLEEYAARRKAAQQSGPPPQASIASCLRGAGERDPRPGVVGR